MSRIGLIIVRIWRKFGLRVPSRSQLVRLFGVAALAAATTFCGRALAHFVGGRFNRREFQRPLHRLDPYLPLDRRGRHGRQHHHRRNLPRGIQQHQNLLENGAAPIGLPQIMPPQMPVIEAPPAAAHFRQANYLPPVGQPMQGQQQAGLYQLPPEEIDEETGLPKAFEHRQLPCTMSVWAELLDRGKVPPINYLQLPPLARGNRGNAVQHPPGGGQQ